MPDQAFASTSISQSVAVSHGDLVLQGSVRAPRQGRVTSHSFVKCLLGSALLWYLGSCAEALADVTAPQAPPELSDTLTDYRTKEQLNEKLYIEGKSDPKNSIDIPTVPSDLEARVMRLSAKYIPQYEIAVPRNGISILRFYDLNSVPLEVVSTRVENQGFLAEVTAAPSELMIRQFQGAASTSLLVRLKGIEQNFLFTLKPLILVNQQSSVHTLLTAMTVNYYIEGTSYVAPAPYKFEQPNPQAQSINFSGVQQGKLEQDLVSAAAIVMPLRKEEQEHARRVRDSLQ